VNVINYPRWAIMYRTDGPTGADDVEVVTAPTAADALTMYSTRRKYRVIYMQVVECTCVKPFGNGNDCRVAAARAAWKPAVDDGPCNCACHGGSR
jgi:hypothetical protein